MESISIFENATRKDTARETRDMLLSLEYLSTDSFIIQQPKSKIAVKSLQSASHSTEVEQL